MLQRRRPLAPPREKLGHIEECPNVESRSERCQQRRFGIIQGASPPRIQSGRMLRECPQEFVLRELAGHLLERSAGTRENFVIAEKTRPRGSCGKAAGHERSGGGMSHLVKMPFCQIYAAGSEIEGA